MSPFYSQAFKMGMLSSQREKPVVLHVDDDEASLMMAESALEDAGFNVVHAGNGIEAIESFKQHTPDLIIMDAVMPIMDGFAAIAAIRALPDGAFVPILMITGLDDLDSITRAYDEGATDFLTKPINFYVLPHRMQYMLRSKLTGDELRASQAKLDNAQRIARLGNWEWNLENNALSCSREFARVMGLTDKRDDCTWLDVLERIEDTDRHNVQLVAEQAVEDSQPFNVEFTVQSHAGSQSLQRLRLEAEPHQNDNNVCTYMLGTLQDITERINAQKQIHDLAYYDVVTGLPDLDHFKQVNDTLGHDAGDDLLKQVSERLTNVVRDSDIISNTDIGDDEPGSQHTVARLGGDEFVVLLGQINRAEDAARVAERIAHTIRQPYKIGDNTVSVTTTIGIGVYPTDGTDCETLMKNADVAMYHAKESGRNGYQFYSRDIHEQALVRFSLEGYLKDAIENEELTIVYQPKVNMTTGNVIAIEALVRWEHAEIGVVSPNEFIPLAEETGLILPLGRWVLKSAAQQMQGWIAQGLAPLTIAVNCSTVQFTRGDLIQDITDTISESGLDPSLLEIELTESLLLQDIEAGITFLRNLKRLGVMLSIDDFGTGYSSLSYLKRLPVDKLKIDKSFVENLSSDKGDVAIVSAIVTLSHNLGLAVVAEGVETLQQYEILQHSGCNEAQGYLFSHPMVAEEFVQWLVDYHAPPLRKASGQ